MTTIPRITVKYAWDTGRSTGAFTAGAASAMLAPSQSASAKHAPAAKVRSGTVGGVMSILAPV